jgi:DNA-binding transcriptional LysR family regulator
MRADHPLARLTEVTAPDLMDYALILFDFNEPILGSRIAETFTREGLYPSISLVSNLSFTSFALVHAGLGVAMVDSYTLPVEGVVTRPYKPDIDLQIHSIFPLGRPQSALVSSFCDDLGAFAASLHHV